MKILGFAWTLALPLLACTASIGEDSSTLDAGATSPFGGPGSSPATSSADSGGSANGGLSPLSGSGGMPSAPTGATAGGGAQSTGGVPAVGGMAATGGACTEAVLPAAVQTMLQNKCATCHGVTPLMGLPSLVSYANLTAPATSDPTKTNAVVALARLQNAAMPMPPTPGAPATAAEMSALQDFIAQGYPKPTCMNGTGGNGVGDPNAGNGGMPGAAGAPALDPLSAMPTCSSMSSWTNGNHGSASMNPGMACISCHQSGEGPSFSIAGTVYPTGHEPDRCNSTIGNAGAQIVIVGADGKQLTLTPNSVGNFSTRTAVKTPYQAKVTYQGRERLMLTAQTSGDCNSCHTQNGNMKAPGRITVP